MNEFEKEINHRLKNDRIPEPSAETLWSGIQYKLNSRNKVDYRMKTIRKIIVAASIAAALILAGGILGMRL